jgi:hypothetical protein
MLCGGTHGLDREHGHGFQLLAQPVRVTDLLADIKDAAWPTSRLKLPSLTAGRVKKDLQVAQGSGEQKSGLRM